MNRRKFLNWLGVGTAIVAVAPSTLLAEAPAYVAPPVAYSTYVMGKDAVISTYADYMNFSDFAISSSVDDIVAQAAEELGKAAAEEVNRLNVAHFDV